ncbi:ribulose-phosphate 3-epimerase [Klebsiella pneumoniae]|uniref:Ribulose-phosphate 3-epimerase n=1 Tax=Klebsiella pneumoniae TaxID=573 RepID=A0A2X3EF11_KLEPN|nr:ribulose-phosphate 3-epimerase [Klebsiella pneumoniae]
MSAKFSPSLMCMDLTQFKEQITAMNKKADFYHVDIMDGNYVRNITLSPFFIENLKKITTVPIDVHLMVNSSGRFHSHVSRGRRRYHQLSSRDGE